jgi:hypothetical protein
MKTIRHITAITALATMIRPFGEAVAEPPVEKPPRMAPAMPEASGTETVKLKDIIIDADTQNRVTLDLDLVESYTEIIRQAKKDEQPIPFPALFVVRGKDGKLYLWDGFHRYDALKAAHEKEYQVDIYDVPAEWEAVEYAQLLSLSANATHGKQRTNKDIQRAVKTALLNPDIRKWSDTIIAQWVGVSSKTVGNYRKAVGEPTTRLAKRGGKTVEIKTGGIGKGKPAKVKPAKKAKGKKEDKKGSASTEAAKKAGEKVDTDLRNAIIKISSSMPTDTLSAQIRKALENDAMGLNRAEVLAWAQTSKERIQSIVNLVLDLEMKPTRAYAFLDKELAGNTNLDTVGILLLAGQKRKDTVGNLDLVFGGDGSVTITLKKKK